jgi:hypothetical protein
VVEKADEDVIEVKMRRLMLDVFAFFIFVVGMCLSVRTFVVPWSGGAWKWVNSFSILWCCNI